MYIYAKTGRCVRKRPAEDFSSAEFDDSVIVPKTHLISGVAEVIEFVGFGEGFLQPLGGSRENISAFNVLNQFHLRFPFHFFLSVL